MIPKRDYYKYPSYFMELLRSFFSSLNALLGILFSWGGRARATVARTEGSHGLHILRADSTGRIECDACGVCEIQCPSQCITVEGQKNQLRSFSIEILNCTFCGICSEVCPIDAILLSNNEAHPGLSQQKWIFDQEILAYRDDINPL